jgi:hypothetical protein
MNRANAVTILAGKIIVAGSTNDGFNNRFAVVRYNASGSLDSSFNTDGKVTTSMHAQSDDIATAIAIQQGNPTVADKIVVAGYSKATGTEIIDGQKTV